MSLTLVSSFRKVVMGHGESGWFSGHQPWPPTSVTRVQLWPWVVCGMRFSRSQSDFEGFSPGTPVSLLKIDSRPIPSGCGAVLRGHTWSCSGAERLAGSTAPSVRPR